MESIKVFVRVRPLAVDDSSVASTDENVAIQVSRNKEITVDSPTRQVHCQYDYVFDQGSTQAEIYKHVRPSVDAVLKGINSTIFAYGQTGSGKTYTMMGRESCIFDKPGIVPRCINDIFQFATRNERHFISVYVSFIQVYNEQAYDMLDDPNRLKPLAIHETSNASNISIPDITEYNVSSYKQCLALIELGLKNRAIRETAMNNASSRSHSILQVTLEQTRSASSNGSFERSTLHSKLNLVDLAGSERWSLNYAQGKVMGDGQISELTNINSSLYTLGRCIAALVQKSQYKRTSNLKNSSSQKHIHVPFRDSKLTRLLQDSLGGNSKIFLIATVNPSFPCADESICTLRFADRAHQVMTFAQVNETLAPKREEIKILQEEIMRLKLLLRSHGISDTHQTKLVNERSRFDDRNINCLRNEQTIMPEDGVAQQQNQSCGVDAFVSNDEGSVNDDIHPQLTCALSAPSKENDSVIVHKKACKKIINALDMVVAAVDSFLSTMKLGSSNHYPMSKDMYEEVVMKTITPVSIENKASDIVSSVGEIIAKQWSPIDQKTGPSLKINKGKDITSSAESNVNMITKRDKLDDSIITSTIETNTAKELSSTLERNRTSSLTSLLQLRKKLKGVDSEEETLKKKIYTAKKQQRQKLQLRQWLLEKEEKTDYPYRTFNNIMD